MLPASALPANTGVVSLVVCAVSVGAAGGVVSSVKLPVPGVALPAASVLVKATACAPSALKLSAPETGVAAPVSSVHCPLLLVSVVKVAPPTVTVTVLPASAVPPKTGVVSLVGATDSVGAAGATVSKRKLPLPTRLLPAASVLLKLTALISSSPRFSVPEVGVTAPVSSDQWPVLSAWTAKVAPPTVTVTALPASAVPASTGVLSLVACVVKLGTAGGVVSIVTVPVPLAALPLASVLTSVTVFAPSLPSEKLPETGVAAPVSSVHTPSPLAVTANTAPPIETVSLLPISAVPVSSGVVSLVVWAVTVGVAGATVSSTKPPLPGVVLPAASVLVKVTALSPSAPIAKVPDTGVAVSVFRLQWPSASAVTT